MQGHLEVVKYLAKAGADLHITNNFSWDYCWGIPIFGATKNVSTDNLVLYIYYDNMRNDNILCVSIRQDEKNVSN